MNEELNREFGKTRSKWNDTALAKCGQWHEAQANTLRSFKRCGVSLQASLDQLDRDIAMHEAFAKACQEAQ